MLDLAFKNNTSKIVTCIQQTIVLFSDDWKMNYGLFFHTEHLTRFVECSITGLHSELKTYALESSFQTIISADASVLAKLIQVYKTLEHKDYQWTPQLKVDFVNNITQLDFTEIMLLMGQRLSSTSLRTPNAMPPVQSILYKACFSPFNGHMSMVVRAWEKHVERSNDTFWPQRKGNPEYKENTMKEFVEVFFEAWEWWNVYKHQKHGYVFELRIRSGHGMRWSKTGQKFIGFLEPFIEHKE